MFKNFVVNWYHTENDELTARFFSQVQKVNEEISREKEAVLKKRFDKNYRARFLLGGKSSQYLGEKKNYTSRYSILDEMNFGGTLLARTRQKEHGEHFAKVDEKISSCFSTPEFL